MSSASFFQREPWSVRQGKKQITQSLSQSNLGPGRGFWVSLVKGGRLEASFSTPQMLLAFKLISSWLRELLEVVQLLPNFVLRGLLWLLRLGRPAQLQPEEGVCLEAQKIEERERERGGRDRERGRESQRGRKGG